MRMFVECLFAAHFFFLCALIFFAVHLQQSVKEHLANARACAKMAPNIDEHLQKIEDLL